MKKTIFLSCIAAVLCFCIGFGAIALVGMQQAAPEETAEPVLAVRNEAEGITVTSRSFYPDSAALMQKLEQIGYGLENSVLTDSTLITELETAVRELEQLGYYYDYIGNTSATAKDGTVYGALSNEQGPIGGGEGYTDIYTTGDYTVTDDNSFYDAVSKAQAGEVIFIQGDAVIDLSDMKYTDYPELAINPGVTVASDRGYNGSGGGVLKFSLHLSTMFTASDDVRITGLVLQGPDARTHESADPYSALDGIAAQGNNIRIDNCEISGFSGAGILVQSGSVQIRHCYIHHIRGLGNGHGILINAADANVEYNLFSNCRNAVTVGPEAGDVSASNNVEVGNGLEAMFCLAAGETESALVPGMLQSGASVTLKNNTVLGTTLPIKLVGMPGTYTVENNLFALQEAQYDAELLYGNAAFRETVKQYSTFRNNAFGLEAPYVLTWNEAAGNGQK